MPRRRRPKKKSNKKKKPKKQALDPEEVRKVLRQYVREYQHICSSASASASSESAGSSQSARVPVRVRAFDSITKPLMRRARSEEDPSAWEMDVVVTPSVGAPEETASNPDAARCNLPSLRALLQSLDHFTGSPRIKATTFEKTYGRLSFLRADLRDEGVGLLSAWIAKNNHVRTLELFDSGLAVRGCAMMAECLRNNEVLTVLIIDNNAIGSEGMVRLADGMQWNTHLQKVSMRYCAVGPHGGRCLGEMVLETCTGLQELNLQGNPLGPEGIKYVAEHLQNATSLTSLNLADTSFGPDMGAMQAICDGLAESPHVKTLNLDLNSIGDAAGGLLMTSIKKSEIKTELVLYPFQEIDTAVFKGILDAGLHNREKERLAARKKKRPRKRKKKKAAAAAAVPPLTGDAEAASSGGSEAPAASAPSASSAPDG